MSSSQGRRRGRQFATLQSLPGSLDWDTCLARHVHLAQPATIAFEFVGLFDILPGASQVLTALFLIVSGLGNSMDRTTINAFPTTVIGEKETVCPVIIIRMRGRFNKYLGHYRSCPHWLMAA